MRAVRVLFVILVALAAACSGKSEGGGDPGPAPGPGTGSASPGPAPTTPPADPRVARGAALHQKYCALCHAKDGTGYAADHAPSLVNPTMLKSADDAFLRRSISLGRPNTPMAGYSKDLGGPLSDAEIDDLVAWMRATGGVAQPEALPPAGKGDAAAGATLYAETCQRCHGDRTTRLTAVQLGHPTFLALASDPFLRYAIVHGRPGTPMEAYKDKLTPQQIDDLVAHLRSWATVGQRPPAPEDPPVAEGPTTSPARPQPPPQPAAGPVVVHEKGKHPSFTLREGRFVPAAQVAAAYKQKRRMVLVDARPSSDWLAARIPGAINVPHYDLSALDKIPNDGTWVLAYCACPHHASGVIVDELRKRGYRNTAVIDEGILFWRKQGYPTEGTSAHEPVPDPHAGHNHAGHAH